MGLALVQAVPHFLAVLFLQTFLLETLVPLHDDFLDCGLALYLKNNPHSVHHRIFQHPHIVEVAGIDQVANVLLDHLPGARFAHRRLDIGHHHRAIDRLRATKPHLDLADDNLLRLLGPGKRTRNNSGEDREQPPQQPPHPSFPSRLGISSSLTSAWSSNLVYSFRKVRFTSPVGPLRCFAMTSTALPFSAALSPSSSA